MATYELLHPEFEILMSEKLDKVFMTLMMLC